MDCKVDILMRELFDGAFPMKKRFDFFYAFLFVLPALAVYLFYFIIPIPTSAYYSFFDWNGISAEMRYLGFNNWTGLFDDPVFWKSLLNNIILVVASILIQLPIALLLAVLVSSKLKGNKLFKLLYFIPMMLSAVAIGMTWNFIYEPNYGLLNSLLSGLGLESLTRGWLGEPQLALGAVIVAICWQYIPFYMVIFAAALSGIPPDFMEAAYIDGASKIQAFFSITIPLLSNTIKTAAILSLTGSLKYFALIFVMTEGGPNHASELMATYMYKQAFTSFRMGYGSTVAVSIFFISFVLTILVLRIGRKKALSYA
jgi:raffinose/stachyose/melibiose transport system permease protein